MDHLVGLMQNSNPRTHKINNMSVILLATEKPFAADAVNKIRNVVAESTHTLQLLESYTDKQQLLDAVAQADALIVRSDKVDADVIAAGKTTDHCSSRSRIR